MPSRDSGFLEAPLTGIGDSRSTIWCQRSEKSLSVSFAGISY
jgi:hypothetical protein